MTDTLTESERGRDIVAAVFDRVRRADISVADLFSEDAVITVPWGDTIVGRPAIRTHYQRVFDELDAQPQIALLLAEPPHYVAVLDVSTQGRPPRRTVDLFEVVDGEIRHLSIWSQSLPQ